MKEQTLLHERARLLCRVQKLTSGCLVWIGPLTKNGGYGVATDASHKYIRAHRYSYQLFNGEIPKGLVVHHVCNNKRCINPKHLKVVTNRENVLFGQIDRGVKNHCKHGHQRNKENTLILKNGWVQCRVCHRDSDRRYALEKKRQRQT